MYSVHELKWPLTKLFESPCDKLVITLTRDAYGKYNSRALTRTQVIFPVIITWSCYNYHIYVCMHACMHACMYVCMFVTRLDPLCQSALVKRTVCYLVIFPVIARLFHKAWALICLWDIIAWALSSFNGFDWFTRALVAYRALWKRSVLYEKASESMSTTVTSKLERNWSEDINRHTQLSETHYTTNHCENR